MRIQNKNFKCFYVEHHEFDILFNQYLLRIKDLIIILTLTAEENSAFFGEDGFVHTGDMAR